MKLKNYLIELLSNIIHEKLESLAQIKEDIKKIDDYKKVEELFSDVNNIINVDSEKLRHVLSSITDHDTTEGIISNVDMIKIVVNGMNDGLELSLDESQEDLIKGVYEIVNNYRTGMETEDNEIKLSLEEFIKKCEELSQEISTGVVRNIETLDDILKENEVPLEDIIKVKFEILRNNSKNYNMELDGKVKEEVELRIILKKIDIDLDSYSEIEKKLLVTYSSTENMSELVDYILENDIKISANNLFTTLLLSDISTFSKIIDISKKYNMNIEELFTIPGVFITNEGKEKISTILADNKEENEFYVIENIKYIGSYHETFINNITLLENNNKNVSKCFENNRLSLIIPDMEKNITILSDVKLSNEEFSIIVINPFLATSISSFYECGLGEYIGENPLRLTTSYHRMRQISSNIVNARKNGKIIFRSLSDKKNYWLSKNITRNSEVG